MNVTSYAIAAILLVCLGPPPAAAAPRAYYGSGYGLSAAANDPAFQGLRDPGLDRDQLAFGAAPLPLPPHPLLPLPARRRLLHRLPGHRRRGAGLFRLPGGPRV